MFTNIHSVSLFFNKDISFLMNIASKKLVKESGTAKVIVVVVVGNRIHIANPFATGRKKVD